MRFTPPEQDSETTSRRW